MARTPPTAPKGTRDYLPRDLVRRNRVFALLRETFERYGYEPLETPAVENTSVLDGKYGEEGERLLFRILKRGHDLESAAREIAGETSAAALSRHLADMALRYDLTVPFARVIAAHQAEILLPFRRYQMQTVWRADRPQRGRYREFYQCDVDCVGSRSVTVEAELLAMVDEIFRALGFKDFTIKINHRALLTALMEGAGVPVDQRTPALIAIDKLDKLGEAGVRAELAAAGIAAETIDRLMSALGVAGSPTEMLDGLKETVGHTPDGALALRELGELFTYLPMLGVPSPRYALDVATVRGLAYYTGIIFETVAADAPVGSLASGGRYDKLIGLFLGRDLPCTGISFGIDRIFTAMEALGLFASGETTTTQALVTVFGPETLPAAFALARELRQAGIRTEVYAEPKELRPQLAFAGDKGIPLVCILGQDEIARGEVGLRDMRTREQRSVPRAQAVSAAKSLLDEREP
jgi:histidyl-tRNA synthetase